MKTVLALVLLFVLPTSRPARAADEPFKDLSYDAALASARAQKRILFLDFFTTWCGPCKRMDQVTWTDPDVRAWLSSKTVALRVDAEKQHDLAVKFGIQAYPTLVFVKSSGELADKVVGFKTPADFLDLGRGVAAGKDAVARANEKLAAADPNDPSAHHEHARALVQAGRLQQAFEEYVWCFDHGLEHFPGFAAERQSMLLSDIAALGQTYRPALEMLQQRRNATEAALRAGGGDPAAAGDMAAINRVLGEDSRTGALFDNPGPSVKDPGHLRRMLFEAVFDSLVQARRYSEIAELGGDLAGRVQADAQTAERARQALGATPGNEESIRALTAQVVARGAKIYEALLGAGRKDDAQRVADRLLGLDPSVSTHGALIAAAVRAGHAEIARAVRDKALSSVPESQRPAVLAAANVIPAD